MSGAQDESGLLRRARSGDPSAFEALVRAHHVRVLGLCVSMLGDRAEAEDAAQEVFLKAFQTLERFRGDSAFGTWLYRVASNHCLDVLRRAGRRREESWDRMLEEDGEALERLVAPGPDPADALESGDLARRALERLAPDYRLALVLREQEGLSYQELCEATGWTLDSVKARLRRARAELEGILRHFSASEDV